MSPEELLFEEYHFLVKTTVHKMFKYPRVYANSKHLDYDDIIQYGRMGLWDAINSWENKQIGSFRNYAIRNIRWSITRYTRREEMNCHYYRINNNNPKNKTISLVSMSQQPFKDDEDTYYDRISSDNINNFTDPAAIENQVISSIEFNELMSILSPEELKLIKFKLDDKLTYEQIASKYGMTKQAIGIKFKKIKKKVNKLLGV